MPDSPSRMKLKVNFPHPDHPEGSVIEIEEAAPGVPASYYWRRRLRDSEIDGCVEIVSDEKPKRRRRAQTEDSEE